MNLYHITTREAWIDATRRGAYVPESLASEGFIHCSTSTELLPVARRYYAGQAGLVLLTIDTSRLSATLKWEPAPDGLAPARSAEVTRFPHVYGPLNLEAVVRVMDFEPDADGEFSTPNSLRTDPGANGG